MVSGSSLGASQQRSGTRIDHACNRCRTKKIRCDGKAPTCSPCEAQNAECTYDQLRRRGKAKKPRHPQSLEQRLKRVESLLGSSTISPKDAPVIRNQPALDGNEEESLGQPAGTPNLEKELSARNPVAESSSPILPSISRTGIASQCTEERSRRGPAIPEVDLEAEKESTNIDLRPFPTPPAMLPLLYLTEDRVKERRETISNRAGRLFIPMFPKAEVLFFVETFLDEVNVTLPLFHKQSIMEMCQRRFPVDNTTNDPAWWACLNTILAIAIQLKTINSAFRSVSDFSWGFFKNAFVVYPELMTAEPSILAIQAILAMGIFMSGTIDSRTTAIFTSTAIRMIQMIGLHRENLDTKLSPVEVEQRRRVFWVAYLLDGVTSIHSGLSLGLGDESIQVNLPSEDSADGLGNLYVSEETGNVNIFRLRIQLAIVELKVQKRLFSSTAREITGQPLQDLILELYYELETWKENVPIEIQPDYGVQAVIGRNDLPVLMLHFAFYNCAGMIYRAAVLHGSQQRGNRISPERSIASMSQLQGMMSTTRYADAAAATIRLLRHVECPLFVDLWRVLQYPLCATITLVARVVENPGDPQALSDVELIGSFVQFLERMQKEEGCDIGQFLVGCTMLEDIAKGAAARVRIAPQGQSRDWIARSQLPSESEASETIQGLKSRLANFASYMHLAQGLMGNIPSLNAAASAVFSDILRTLKIGAASAFGPESLVPGTYGFGLLMNQARKFDSHSDCAVHADNVE